MVYDIPMDHRSKVLDFFNRPNSKLSGHIHFASHTPGPRLIIIGGTHGNEPAGVDAMYKICRFFQEGLQLESGSIDLIIGNPEAYLKNVRYIDFDLNRAFGEDQRPSDAFGIELQRAEELNDFLVNSGQYDMLVDLHSVSRGNEKIQIYRKDQVETEKFIKNMNFDYHQLVYASEYLTGLLIDIAYSQKAKAIAVECGNHNSDQAYLVGSRIILKTLEQMAMISNSDAANFIEKLTLDRIIKQKYSFVIFDRVIPNSDDFKFIFNEDETIITLSEGQIYAESEGEILKAKSDCFLMMPSKNVKKSDVDAGFFCTRHPVL